MTYKQIESSKEARLWISQVIIPVATVTVMIFSIPEARNAVSNGICHIKETCKKVFKRKTEAE